MRNERLWFGFFILLALTLNFGFFYGQIDNPIHHNKVELFLTFIVSLICTILKFGDRTQMGALLLATSLVSDVQLLAGILTWVFHIGFINEDAMAVIVSFSGGALLANLVSVILVVIETTSLKR